MTGASVSGLGADWRAPVQRIRITVSMAVTPSTNDAPATPGLRGQWRRFRRALERHTLLEILGGVWIARHFDSRAPVVWTGGFPPPRIKNRGRLETGGCTLFTGVRIEVTPGATLSIGKGTMINRDTYIVCHDRVTIGERCLISWDVVIMDDDQHERAGLDAGARPVVIEDDAWVGCRTIIMKGVTIGRGAVIGAGSIVTRDVPPETLAVGQPARVVKSLAEQPDLPREMPEEVPAAYVAALLAADRQIVDGGLHVDADSTATRPTAGML